MRLHQEAHITCSSAQDWCGAPGAKTGTTAGRPSLSLGTIRGRHKAEPPREAPGQRSVATIPAPIEALTDMVEVTVVPGPAPVEAVVDVVAAPVETILETVALAVQAHRAALITIRRGTL